MMAFAQQCTASKSVHRPGLRLYKKLHDRINYRVLNKSRVWKPGLSPTMRVQFLFQALHSIFHELILA